MANSFFKTMNDIKDDPMIFLAVKAAISQEKESGKYLDSTKVVERGDLAYYFKSNFSKMQIYELALGVLHGVDISIYGYDYFSAKQMREIRTGLELGINILTVADVRFNDKQLQEIRFLLMEGVDPKIIANPRLSSFQMKQISKLILAGDISSAEAKASEWIKEDFEYEDWAMNMNSFDEYNPPRRKK